MEAKVVFNQDVALKDLGGGVSRKVLAYNDELMIVEVHFEKGGVGSPHSHPHAQSTYVKSGMFRFTLDGKEAVVAAGDTLAMPGGLPHGTVCLQAGVLIDIFTPMRKDFVEE